MEDHTALGITLGDPSGIGPEVIVGALATMPSSWRAQCTIYGDREPLERAARALGRALPDVRLVGVGDGDRATPGCPDERSGAAQVGYLEAAVAAAKRGEHAALVTAPISKMWARRGGFSFLGHTEMLAQRLGARDVAMFFVGPKLKIALATVHRPLVEVVQELSTERIRKVVEMLAESLVRDFSISEPRIGVVGLNPHAGEDGLLGDEDEEIIKPALALPCGSAHLFGPLVPDAAFRDQLHGKYDAVVAMYHDQGLIPVKLIDFDESVNVTLGLPIVRTSPDHGTAYDIAGKGIARPTSMQRAIALAIQMLQSRGGSVG